MSTRSMVGVQLTNGSIISVYVHYDGYPEAREPLLHKYFNTYRDALELVSHGNICSIGKGIEKCEFFNDEYDDAIVANLAEFLKIRHGDDFKYLFTKGEWYWVKTGYNGDWDDEVMEILPYGYKAITIYD